MDLEYKYFAMAWGKGGPTHGAYSYTPLNAATYEEALTEAASMREHGMNIDPFHPVANFAVKKGTTRPLSQWELDRATNS